MKTVHVAVGVIKNSAGKILLSKRAESQHQGGLWEFPGGKVEAGETLFQALKRELHEELDLTIFNSIPLIKIAHDYGDKKVLLDVHWVTEFSGAEKYDVPNAVGKEGQPIIWADRESLNNFSFPAANVPIITAIKLPDYFAITGQATSHEQYLEKIERGLQSGIRLIQLRTKTIQDSAFNQLAFDAAELCKKFNAELQLNTSVENFLSLSIENSRVGLHLDSLELKRFELKRFELKKVELKKIESRDFFSKRLISASCHNQTDIEYAKKMGVDFICLSPVKETASHPQAKLLGWENFSDLVAYSACPVYALGGMGRLDIAESKERGAQGVAAISDWWN